MNNPYNDVKINENIFIRYFKKNNDSDEFIWHMDKRNRVITPLNINDWYIQFDNELPIKLDKKIFVKKDNYHRLIKGNTDLTLEIFEFLNND